MLPAGPKGAELIAARWAEARGVTQVAFKVDWTRRAKAAHYMDTPDSH